MIDIQASEKSTKDLNLGEEVDVRPHNEESLAPVTKHKVAEMTHVGYNNNKDLHEHARSSSNTKGEDLELIMRVCPPQSREE